MKLLRAVHTDKMHASGSKHKTCTERICAVYAHFNQMQLIQVGTGIMCISSECAQRLQPNLEDAAGRRSS